MTPICCGGMRRASISSTGSIGRTLPNASTRSLIMNTAGISWATVRMTADAFASRLLHTSPLLSEHGAITCADNFSAWPSLTSSSAFCSLIRYCSTSVRVGLKEVLPNQKLSPTEIATGRLCGPARCRRFETVACAVPGRGCALDVLRNCRLRASRTARSRDTRISPATK